MVARLHRFLVEEVETGRACCGTSGTQVVHNAPMSHLLYYDDPTLLSFDATVESVDEGKECAEVILDQTAFYPEGGGQPADRGSIDGAGVVHVRKENGAAIHLLAPGASAPPVGKKVHCEIDGIRRRVFMQQHTGQHVLSGALVEVGGYNTVSVHQGEDYTTIELDTASIPLSDLRLAEELANSIIEQNLPVTDQWVDDSQIGNFPLRRPPKVAGSVRLVQVGEFDCVACGGVHLTNTAAIRLVHAIGVQTIRGHARIYWMIGDRAVADYRQKSEVVRSLTEMLSAKPTEVTDRVRKLADRGKELEAEVKRSRARVAQITADSLISEAEPTKGRRVVTAQFFDEDRSFLRSVAETLVAQTGVAACITNRSGGQLNWVIGVAPGAGVEFELMKSQLLEVIDGKGGGKPPLWQGVGSKVESVQEFLSMFRELAR